jgi:hypothetical protein
VSGIFLGAVVWPGGTLEFNDTINPEETYTFNSELNRTPATFYDLATDIVSWLNDAGRAWTGVITTTMAVTTPSTPHLGVDLTFTGGVFRTTGLGGLAQAYTGWADAVDASSITGGNVPSSARADVAMHHYINQPEGKGSVCQGGSWAMIGSNVGDARRPSCKLTMDEAQAMAFAVALRGSGSPRHCHVYDGINDAWRRASLGHVRDRQMGTQHQSAVLSLVA